MQNNFIDRQTWKAFALSPIIPILLFCALDFKIIDLGKSLSFSLIYLIVGLPYAYAVMAVVGIPSLIWLKTKHLYKQWVVILIAFLCGPLIEIYDESSRILRNLTDPSPSTFSLYAHQCQIIIENVRTACGWRLLLERVALYACLGGLTGYIFWRLDNKHRTA